MSNLKGFVIYAPHFIRNCAGVYSLYKIAKDIQDLGYTSMMTIWGSNGAFKPVFGVPIVPNYVAYQFLQTDGYAIIYPEVIPGNPLQAKNVVRWVLDVPGKQGGESIYDNNEIIFAYSQHIADRVKGNKVEGIIELPTIDTNLFFNDEKPKTDITVYTGKKKFIDGYVDRYDNLITRTSPTRDEVAKILRRTKILYTFDPFTILIHEAMLCGANVVILDNDANVDFSKHELGSVGIHLDRNNIQLEDPNNIVKCVKDGIHTLEQKYSRQLSSAIGIIQNRIS